MILGCLAVLRFCEEDALGIKSSGTRRLVFRWVFIDDSKNRTLFSLIFILKVQALQYTKWSKVKTNQTTEIYVFSFKYISFDVTGNNRIFPARIQPVTEDWRLSHTLSSV